jgi:hypothetical protein
MGRYGERGGRNGISWSIGPGSTGLNPGSTGLNPGSTGLNPGSTGLNPGSTGLNPGSTGLNPGGPGEIRVLVLMIIPFFGPNTAFWSTVCFSSVMEGAHFSFWASLPAQGAQGSELMPCRVASLSLLGSWANFCPK